MNTRNFKLQDFLKYLLIAIIVGTLISTLEYYIRINSSDPQAFFPLLIRATIAIILIVFSIQLVDAFILRGLRKKRFLNVVLYRAAVYTFIITFWLLLMNGIWGALHDKKTVTETISAYIQETTYIVNLGTAFLIILIIIAVQQISKLHRKGELFEFITGKYHTPREVQRIFCFIDLTGSTALAEKLGHYKYSCFLQDFYSDITDAIVSTKAEVYQYVGDEVVLTWPLETGLKDGNALSCFLQIKSDLKKREPKYLDKYGVAPKFKAGIHGGKVIVTWVGEVKKAIVFVGDVVNTAARIQEVSKTIDSDFLISEELLGQFNTLQSIKATFVNEITPRGKQQAVRIFSLETI